MRISSGEVASSDSSMCQAPAVSGSCNVSSPTLCSWSRMASSSTAVSGRGIDRPATSRVSGVTVNTIGPDSVALVPAATMRASADWMVGWLGGYIDTLRIALLHARANSATRLAAAAAMGSGVLAVAILTAG